MLSEKQAFQITAPNRLSASGPDARPRGWLLRSSAYTIGQYLNDAGYGHDDNSLPEFKEAEQQAHERIAKFMGINGNRTPESLSP